MDINALLSPDDSAADAGKSDKSPSKSPSKKAARTRPERPSGKRTPSSLSQEVPRSPDKMTARPALIGKHAQRVPAHSQQQREFNVQSGSIAAPNFRPLPPTSVPHADTVSPYGYVQQGRPLVAHRPSSMPQVETLADLAASIHVQHRQQTPRTYSANNVHAEQQRPPLHTAVHSSSNSNSSNSGGNSSAIPIARAISRQSLADITMAEAPSQTPPPRDFTSQSLSDDESKVVTELLNFLADNSYAYDQHVQLINLLHKGFLAHVDPPVDSDEPAPAGDPRSYVLLNELRQAREAMDTRFAVGEALWIDWLADEAIIAKDSSQRIGLIELFDRAVSDEPSSVTIWKDYISWVQTNYSACAGLEGADLSTWSDDDLEVCKDLFTKDMLITVMQRALDATKWRIDQSHLLWNQYAEIVVSDLPEEPAEEDIRGVHGLFVERLKTPHTAREDTMQIYWPLISKFEGSNWEAAVAQVNQMTESAKSATALREVHEVKLQRAIERGDVNELRHNFDKYLKSERYAHKKPGSHDYDLRAALYERALLRFPTATEWWLDYVDFVLTEQASESRSLLPIIERATRHCPWSGDLWSRRILRADVEQKSREEIENTKHRATNAGLLDVGGMEELVKMLQQWCTYLRRHAFSPTSNEDDIDTAEVGIMMALEDVQQAGVKIYGQDFRGDPLFRLEQVQIKFYTEARRLDDARNIFRQLSTRHSSSYDLWAKYYHWELWLWGYDRIREQRRVEIPENGPDLASAVCREALRQRDVDWPDKLLEMYLCHFQQHESGVRLQRALADAREYANRLAAKRAKEAEEAATLAAARQQEIVSAAAAAAAAVAAPRETATPIGEKRKRDEEPLTNGDAQHKKPKTANETKHESSAPASAQIKRDREHNTIAIRNLPKDIEEVDIKKFFRDCGNPPAIHILRDTETASATVEFQSEEDVLAAKTRNGRQLNGREVQISSGSQSTLYVTNYPEAYDERAIRGLFESYGGIVSVRLPSLKFNSRRRFCYVQFLTAEQAKAAEAAMNGKKLDGLHTLLAKISNPDAAKHRGGAQAEGREVFARNIDRDSGEAKIKEFFSQFGTLERVNLLRLPHKNQLTGTGFFVYASADEANAAVAGANNKPFGDRVIHAEISNAKGRAAPNERAHKEDILVKKASATPEPSGRRDSDAPMADAKAGVVDQGDSKARKVAVFNIPDTVNDARIRTALEKYGPIVKIQLRRDKGGAIVEYENVKDAFSVKIGVDVTTLGPQASTGDVTDLLSKVRKQPFVAATGNGDVAPRSSSLAFVPSAASRPGQGRGGRGNLGGRRGGLGFKRGGGAPSSSNAAAAAEPGKKGNNDFRAMLEASKTAKTEETNDAAE